MSGNRVFVGRLTGLRENVIRNYFAKFDPNVRLLLNTERGFAYVTFSSAAIAEKILQQDHFIENRKVNVKEFKQNDEQPAEITPVPVFTEAYLQSLPRGSSLLYGEFLDFFYKPILVEPVKLVIIFKGANHAKPLGFGFLNSREHDGLQTGRSWILLKCELARLVEVVRQSHCDCHRGCELRGTNFGKVMGFPTETLTSRLPNFPDASLYYRPQSSVGELQNVPSLPISSRDSGRFFEGYDQTANFDFVLIDQDRTRGLCGFGVVPGGGGVAVAYSREMTRIVQNVISIICNGIAPFDQV